MMGRPRACQQTFSTRSDCVQNNPSISFFISSHVLSVWDGPWSFHNSCYLMLFCLDLSRAGGVSSSSRHNYQISYLSPVPPALCPPAPLPPSSPCPAVWEDCSGFSCHTPRAGSGFGPGARTCANCLTPCASVQGRSTLMSALKCH